MIVFPFFAFGNEDGWFECSENIFHLGSIRPAKVVKLYYFPKQLGTYMINLLSIVEIIYSKLTLLERSYPWAHLGPMSMIGPNILQSLSRLLIGMTILEMTRRPDTNTTQS